jgi:AraC-like DNA-binding protein
MAVVFWFRAEWIEKMMASAAELSSLKSMLTNAGRGLLFSGPIAAAVRPLVTRLVGLEPARRLVGLLEALVALSRDSNAECLASTHWRSKPSAQPDRPRFERVLDHIHAHYQSRLTMEELADIAHLSLSGFGRLFHRHAQMTTSDYIAQLRVGRACQLLMTSSLPIAHIAAECGYENLSHFNRQFRALKRSAPRDFRRHCVLASQTGSQVSTSARPARNQGHDHMSARTVSTTSATSTK